MKPFSCAAIRILCTLTVSTLALLSSSSQAAQAPVAKLSPAQKNAKLPPGLKWKSEKLQVVSRVRGKKLRTYAVLRGFFVNKDWQLKINQKDRLRISKDKGRFALAVRLQGKNTPLVVNAMGPKGEKITYKANVVFNGYDVYQKAKASEMKDELSQLSSRASGKRSKGKKKTEAKAKPQVRSGKG